MMETYTVEFGGLSAHQHVSEDLRLPLLPRLGAIPTCRRALDFVAAHRVGVAVVGSKGTGKTAGTKRACAQFGETEREKRARHNGYEVRRVLQLRAIRCKTDRELILHLAKVLSPTYSDRVRGARKTVLQIREEVVALCKQKQYAVIVVDEAETYSDQAIECLRDLLTDSQEEDSERFDDAGAATTGIGLLLVGDETFLDRLGRMREAGHRWRQAFAVEDLSIDHLPEVYGAWFPGFAAHVEKVGDNAWANYLASMIGRGRPISFRFLENQARVYVHYMVRTDLSITARENVPFHRHFFELAANECAWASVSPTAPEKKATGRRRARGPKGSAGKGA